MRKQGFYCAQDADSDGIEGKYYVFTPDEIVGILRDSDGERFNSYFDITGKGNFEGKNIPNLIHNDKFDDNMENLLPPVYEYRRNRAGLHKDDKILTSWNCLMIAAFAAAYGVLGDAKYLNAAQKACGFINKNLADGNKLFVSYRDGKRSDSGFLDDYAFYIIAQIKMYEVTFEKGYLDRAIQFNEKAVDNFYDAQNGGFYLYGKDGEQLILRPKETYDGAIPSGNSVMAYNLIKLSRLNYNEGMEELSLKQMEFMAAHSGHYPAAYCFYMLSLLMYFNPNKKIVCVLKNETELEELKSKFPSEADVIILTNETAEYPLKNDRTTFYVCEKDRCLPPANNIEF